MVAMQEFSMLTGDNWGALPELFTQEDTLAEAAVSGWRGHVLVYC